MYIFEKCYYIQNYWSTYKIHNKYQECWSNECFYFRKLAKLIKIVLMLLCITLHWKKYILRLSLFICIVNIKIFSNLLSYFSIDIIFSIISRLKKTFNQIGNLTILWFIFFFLLIDNFSNIFYWYRRESTKVLKQSSVTHSWLCYW